MKNNEERTAKTKRFISNQVFLFSIADYGLIFINNYMNKRNTSEIKIRKKTSFRPIMLSNIVNNFSFKKH